MNKPKISIIALVSILLLIIVAYFILAGRKDTQKIIISGQVFEVEVVSSGKDVTKGLSGRDSIESNQGMLFVFDNRYWEVFWMKDMKFNIDLLWLVGDIVVGYEKNMPAPPLGVFDEELKKYASPEQVDRVLELSAGTIDRLNVKIGDRINLNP